MIDMPAQLFKTYPANALLCLNTSESDRGRLFLSPPAPATSHISHYTVDQSLDCAGVDAEVFSVMAA